MFDRPEWCRNRKTAPEIAAAAHGMAIVAIADRGEDAATSDKGGVERLR
jgi:hypothetical protein